MASPPDPLEHKFCSETGEMHSVIFASDSPRWLYCGHCGIRDPLAEHQSRQITNTELSESKDHLPIISPTSRVKRERSQSSASGLPETQSFSDTQTRPVLKRLRRHTSHRKLTAPQQDTIGLIIDLHVLIVFYESVWVEELASPCTIQSIRSISEAVRLRLAFSVTEMADWNMFNAVLYETLDNLPELSDIYPGDSTRWKRVWATGTNGKTRMTTTGDVDSFVTPADLIHSGIFDKNRQGHRQIYLALTAYDN